MEAALLNLADVREGRSCRCERGMVVVEVGKKMKLGFRVLRSKK